MSTEQERKAGAASDDCRAVRAVLADRERELLEIKGPCSTNRCPLHFAHSGPCTLPPEPEWKPGQYARVRAHGTDHLAKRTVGGGWQAIGWIVPFADSNVTDVEPVAVLTAEDAHFLVTSIYEGERRAFLAERGLSTDER